jgi:anti-sigma regulatory factor (Ser/Thr protein kinase)
LTHLEALVRDPRHAFRFPGTLAGFEAAARTLLDVLSSWPLDRATCYKIELAFEEIGTNIVLHGAPTEDVEVTVSLHEQEVVLTFEHDGIEFDPRAHPAPVTPASIEDAKVGGLGIMLVKDLAARLDYERTADRRNHLTVAIAIG